MNSATLSPQAFESRYRLGRDPWSFAQSPYELGRYRTIIASLQRSSYAAAYEPGCSVGVLTRQLAAMAARVTAIDFAPSAVTQAKTQCAGCDNVELICADVRIFMPAAPLDLIVFSEIGYYFSLPELSQLAAGLANRMVTGGEFIAAHWLGSSTDHVLHGNQVHECLREGLPLRPLKSEVHRGFRLDSWVKP